MNGSLWTSSAKWPLSSKMRERECDFPPTSLARLEALPQTDIAWFDPGRHPAQGMIAISDSAAGAIGTIRDDAFTAISVVSDSTGNALGKSYQKQFTRSEIPRVGWEVSYDANRTLNESPKTCRLQRTCTRHCLVAQVDKCLHIVKT